VAQRGALRVRYRGRQGEDCLLEAEQAAAVLFEDCPPVRRPPSYPGQWHTPGRYWCATIGDLLVYESFLEYQWLVLLDFDRSVATVNTQALEFHGRDGTRRWRHVPDIFTRRVDGRVEVLDVKHPSRHTDPDVAEQAARTARACRDLGWDYRMVGAPPQQYYANLAWLAGYRRPLRATAGYASEVIRAAARPITLGELADHTGAPELARPVIFHQLWTHQLRCELETQPVSDRSLIQASPGTSALGDGVLGDDGLGDDGLGGPSRGEGWG
jgi:hypothetical protein